MTDNDQIQLKWLYYSLFLCKRPEDVAACALKLLKNRLDEPGRYSIKYCLQTVSAGCYGSSPATPVNLQRQVSRALKLFTTAYFLDDRECDNPDTVEQFIRHISQEIHKSFGSNNFKTDRLNRQARSDLGMDISNHCYNKRFRYLTYIESQLSKLISKPEKLIFTKVGKSGLFPIILQDNFLKDPDSACFIAYYVATSNLAGRRHQESPYDKVSDVLFERCQKNSTTNWWAIAHVYPTQEVIAYLSDRQKGELLGKWYGILEEAAKLLKKSWDCSNINRSMMFVPHGNDRKIWNTAANAWNTSRNNWISLLYSMGMQEIIQSICVGKVLRLMRADFFELHHSTDGQIDPDTAVWNELPLPWEILSGQQFCNLAMVESICQKYNVDPVSNGWLSPFSCTQTTSITSLQELVHGISVSNSMLAQVLSSAGFFSRVR
jgi:hypothetical protein